MEESDALRKAQGLLNKAADPSCTDEERELLEDKAFEIISKYGIDAALAFAKAEVRSKPTKREFEVIGAQCKYRVHAASYIAEACRVRAVIVRNRQHGARQGWGAAEIRNRRTLVIIGFESDIDIFEMLWTSLQLQGMREVAKIKKTTVMEGPGGYIATSSTHSTKAMRNSFWMGFGQRVRDRIIEANKKSSSAPGTDLVLYDRAKEVDEAMNEMYPKLGTLNDNIDSGLGYNLGREAGDRANIHDKAELSKRQGELT